MSDRSGAELLAREFHEAYEALAPSFGWETQAASRTTWEQVPESNRSTMIATAAEVLARRLPEQPARTTLRFVLLCERTGARVYRGTCPVHLSAECLVGFERTNKR